MQREFMLYPYRDKSLSLDNDIQKMSVVVPKTRDGLGLCDAFGVVMNSRNKTTSKFIIDSYYVLLSERDREMLRQVLGPYCADLKMNIFSISRVKITIEKYTETGNLIGMFLTLLNQCWDNQERQDRSIEVNNPMNLEIVVKLPGGLDSSLPSEGLLNLNDRDQATVGACLENYIKTAQRGHDPTNKTLSPGRDYDGSDYFSSLSRSWNLISRGDDSFSLDSRPYGAPEQSLDDHDQAPPPHIDNNIVDGDGVEVQNGGLFGFLPPFERKRKINVFEEQYWKRSGIVWNNRDDENTESLNKIYSGFMRSFHIQQLRTFIKEHLQSTRKLEALVSDSLEVNSKQSVGRCMIRYWLRNSLVPEYILAPSGYRSVELCITSISLVVLPKRREFSSEVSCTESVSHDQQPSGSAKSAFRIRLENQVLQENVTHSAENQGRVEFVVPSSTSIYLDEVLDFELHEYLMPRSSGFLEDSVIADELALGFLFFEDVVDEYVQYGPDCKNAKTIYLDLIKYSPSRRKAVIDGKLRLDLDFTLAIPPTTSSEIEPEPVWGENTSSKNFKGSKEYLEATARNVEAMRALLNDPIKATYSGYNRPPKVEFYRKIENDRIFAAVASLISDVEYEFTALSLRCREKFESGKLFDAIQGSTLPNIPSPFRVTCEYGTTYRSSKVGEWYLLNGTEENDSEGQRVDENSFSLNSGEIDGRAAFTYFCTRSSAIRHLTLLETDSLSLEIDLGAYLIKLKCSRFGFQSESTIALPKQYSISRNTKDFILRYCVKIPEDNGTNAPLRTTNRKVWRWNSGRSCALYDTVLLNLETLVTSESDRYSNRRAELEFKFFSRNRQEFTSIAYQKLNRAYSLCQKLPLQRYENPNIRKWLPWDHQHDDPLEDAAHRIHYAVREICGVTQFHLSANTSVMATEDELFAYLRTNAELCGQYTKYNDTLLHVFISQINEISKISKSIGQSPLRRDVNAADFVSNKIEQLNALSSVLPRIIASNDCFAKFLSNGVKVLLELGSPVNAGNKDGLTAVDMLVRMYRISVYSAVCHCIRHGATNTITMGGRPTIYFALRFRHFDVAKEMMINDWPTIVKDKVGEYPVLLTRKIPDVDLETQQLLWKKFGFDDEMISSFDLKFNNREFEFMQVRILSGSTNMDICAPTSLTACYICRALSLRESTNVSIFTSDSSYQRWMGKIFRNDSNEQSGSYSALAEVIGRYLLSTDKLKDISLGLGELRPVELANMLKYIPTSNSLRILDISSWETLQTPDATSPLLGQILSDFINSPKFLLTKLSIENAKLTTKETCMVLSAIRRSNRTLTTLSLCASIQGSNDVEEIINPLVELIRHDTILKSLNIEPASNIAFPSEAISTALVNNTTLEILFLQKIQFRPIEPFAEVFALNSTLEDIRIAPPEDPAKIVSAIASNPSSHLTNFDGIKLGSQESRKILGLDSSFKNKSNNYILRYLKESKSEGVISTSRARIVFAGNGETGKTTLIRRLREGVFDESSTTMTDGIDISSLLINGVEMTLFDFAGQPEYEHTHTLFFDQSAVYLLLFNPRAGGEDRLKVFVDMITNCAPTAEILLVTTRADEARLDEVKKQWILNLSPRIVEVIPIDSKSGTGLETLRESMVNAALRLESTVKNIPKSFDRLRQEITILGKSLFSISVEELTRLATNKFNFPANLIDMAIDLFVSWGYIHRLSNGDIVLKPKQLADVLKCIFTKVENTRRRAVDVQEGVLRHTNEVLDSIWQREFPMLNKSMWRCSDNELSPFINLLHQAGLAFQLYDPQGKPIGASIVPALLPSQPCGFDRVTAVDSRQWMSDAEYYDKLFELFVPQSMWQQRQPQVTIAFDSPLPGPFFGRLQVKLRRMATLGGAWRTGCSLVLKQVDVDAKEKDNLVSSTAGVPETVGIKSLVVVTVSPSSPNTIEFIGAGPDSSARTTVLNVMLALVAKKFQSIRINNVSLLFKGRRYNEDDIRESIMDGFIVHKATHEKIHIGSLRLLFPDVKLTGETPFNSQFAASIVEGPESTGTTGPETYDVSDRGSKGETQPEVPPSLGKMQSFRRNMSRRGLVGVTGVTTNGPTAAPGSQSKCPPALLREFDKLQAIIDVTERELSAFAESEADVDMVSLSTQFAACLPHFLTIQGIKFSKKRGLSTMWLPFLEKGKKRLIIAPLSPTRIQGNDEWYPLVDEAAVEIRPENIVDSPEDLGWRKEVSPAATLQLQRAVKILSIPLPRGTVLSSLCMLTDVEGDMRKLEITNFEDIENVMIMRKLATQANTMLLSKQIAKASRQTDYKMQAQERLLQKISQQNEEQSKQLQTVTQIVQRIETSTSQIAATINTGFSTISSQLAGNEEGMAEINELWSKRIGDLEKLISSSGQDVLSKLNLQLDKFEKKFNAALFDLDVDTKAMESQFAFLRKELTEVAEAQQRGEVNAEKRMLEVMTELKALNVKVDRVEAAVQKIFVGLQTGFGDVRAQLASNSEGLAELRDVWDKKIVELERALKSSDNSEQKIGVLFEKMEKKMIATLFDLDLNPTLLSDQLKDVKQQLSAACSALQRQEEQSEVTLTNMMMELKGLHSQLTEVLSLQKETADMLSKGLKSINKLIVNVNSRTCPTTFVLVPAVDESASLATKKGLFSRMKQVYDAVTEPKATLVSLLRDSYHVVLICEVCKQPPDDKSLWYTLTKPGERVGKILPLAKTGLAIACGINKLSAVGRIFGLPTPVLQDSTFADASEFLGSLGDNILEKYAELQKIAEENHSTAGPETDPSKRVESIGDLGFCVREFQLFLSEVDPAKVWANLSMKSSPDGNICFACRECCRGR